MAEGTVTVAGWMGALIVYALSAVTTKIGAIIILAVCMLFLAYLSYITFKNGEVAVEKKAKKTENGGSAYGAPVEIPLTQQSQQSETIMQDAPTTQPSYTQPTYASETAMANGYATGNVAVTQQPAFSLSDERVEPTQQSQNANVGGAFSPFGKRS